MQYYALMPLLLNGDNEAFRSLMRITPELWQHIMGRVATRIQKQDRSSLELGLKLAVMLRYLVMGETFRSFTLSYRVSQCSIMQFLPKVCEHIFKMFRPKVMPIPHDASGWRRIAEASVKKWIMPYCLGGH